MEAFDKAHALFEQFKDLDGRSEEYIRMKKEHKNYVHIYDQQMEKWRKYRDEWRRLRNEAEELRNPQ
jgi:hypothetical protein